MPTETGGQANFVLDRYDTISKGTFDAWTNAEISKTMLEAPSFERGVVTLLSSAGVSQKYLHGITGEEVGSEDWMDTFRKAATESSEYALETAIAGAAGVIFGAEAAQLRRPPNPGQ